MSFLDLARWCAASIVFLGHLRNPLFQGYNSLVAEDQGALVRVWYFVTGLHAEAVVVFFVLSGFLVGGLSCGKMAEGRFSLTDYGIDRVSRLFIAYFPALAVTAAVDHFGVSCCSGSGLYDHTQLMIREKITGDAFSAAMQWGVLGANLLMLQTFFFPPFGSNQPLWTISAEFWFYAVFGLLAAAWRARRGRSGVLWAFAAMAAFFFLGGHFLPLFGLWVIGGLAAFLSSRIEQPVLAITSFVLIMALSRVKQQWVTGFEYGVEIKNYVVALTFCWAMVSMRNVSSKILIRLAPFNEFMAKFSYSLYLVHFPVLFFALAVLYQVGGFSTIFTGYRPTSPEGLALYVACAAFVYLFAYMFAYCTERQTGRLRRAVKDRLARIGHRIREAS